LTSPAAYRTIWHVPEQIEYRWRGPVTDAEMVALVTAHGGRAAAGWWDQITGEILHIDVGQMADR
jgi:hypothetical protein